MRVSCLAAVLLGIPGTASAAVTVKIDGADVHQLMQGFGATTMQDLAVSHRAE
jgi:TctA family transporter